MTEFHWRAAAPSWGAACRPEVASWKASTRVAMKFAGEWVPLGLHRRRHRNRKIQEGKPPSLLCLAVSLQCPLLIRPNIVPAGKWECSQGRVLGGTGADKQDIDTWHSPPPFFPRSVLYCQYSSMFYVYSMPWARFPVIFFFHCFWTVLQFCKL